MTLQSKGQRTGVSERGTVRWCASGMGGHGILCEWVEVQTDNQRPPTR